MACEPRGVRHSSPCVAGDSLAQATQVTVHTHKEGSEEKDPLTLSPSTVDRARDPLQRVLPLARGVCLNSDSVGSGPLHPLHLVLVHWLVKGHPRDTERCVLGLSWCSPHRGMCSSGLSLPCFPLLWMARCLENLPAPDHGWDSGPPAHGVP